MKSRVSTSVLVGVWTVAMVALLPRGSRAQPGGGGGGGGGGGPAKQEEGDGVECAQNGTDAHYEERIAGTGPTMVRWAASDTSCPNHVNWPINPNAAWVAAVNMSLPAYPMLIENGGTTDLSLSAGGIGMMRNGVAMFSAWARDQVVEYEDTAFYLEMDTFDPCGGHATPTGSYHYHGTPGCLQEQAGAVAGEHSPLLGWAADGFPFYGQLGPGGVEMKMCGAEGADEVYCLDGCMGYEAYIDEDEFAYRYYTSCGYDESFFPFSANCFRGCCPDGMTCDSKVEACTDGAEIGYSESHVPVASESLADVYDAALIVGDDLDILGSKTTTIDCTLYLGSTAPLMETPDSTAAPTAEETPETSFLDSSTTPMPGFMCQGETGILNKDICCASSCGTCGGEGCTEFEGGEDACCTSDIRRAGQLCVVTGAAPCIMITQVEPDTPEPTAAPTVEETHEEAMPVSGFMCEGEMGILNKDICCATSCGTCGGEGCTEFEGGEDACCTSDIRRNGALCSVTGAAPCIMVTQVEPDTPEPTAAPIVEETTSTYREIGCFADKSGADRVKTNMVASYSMTVDICQKHCVGSMYFGVQWSVECWCDDGQGDIDYPFDTHGPSEECTMACAGDATQICGGDWAMNVYENI